MEHYNISGSGTWLYMNVYEQSMILMHYLYSYIDGLVQDCSNFIVLAMEILQSCVKPLISYYCYHKL